MSGPGFGLLSKINPTVQSFVHGTNQAWENITDKHVEQVQKREKSKNITTMRKFRPNTRAPLEKNTTFDLPLVLSGFFLAIRASEISVQSAWALSAVIFCP